MSRMHDDGLSNDFYSSLAKKITNFVNGTSGEADEDIAVQESAAIISDETDGISDEFFMEDYLKAQNEKDLMLLRQKREKRASNKNLKLLKFLYPIGAVIMGVAIMLTLIITVSNLPEFAASDNPVNNEVPARYIEHGMQETGTVNVVTGLILNYRGFDTMGETHVLFIAASTVMILLLVTKRSFLGVDYENDRDFEPKNDEILKKVATFLVPVIAVFGIYVVLNGHLSPGGGFSGGAILGAGLILYVSAFGFSKTQKFFNEHIYVVAKVSALCCYVSCLSYYFFMGANGLNNHIPLGTPGNIISSGLILLIDIFVGTEVACTMYAFYALFRRGGL